jgi:hypothetical protein
MCDPFKIIYLIDFIIFFIIIIIKSAKNEKNYQSNKGEHQSKSNERILSQPNNYNIKTEKFIPEIESNRNLNN